MFDASVIICSHNPREEFLERTLNALRGQTVRGDRWELILVDNASSNPLAGKWDLSWHPHGRHAVEPQLGLAYARKRGIQESSGGLLIFVDDDNVLASDYVAEALRIEKQCQFLGAWGSGSISPEFEAEPPEHLRPFMRMLAIRQVERAIWSNSISCFEATPCGAGLCIRRSVGEIYLERSKKSRIEISGRKGSSLGGDEDTEICYFGCETGLGMGVFPELKMLHLIPRKRVSEEYILKLMEDSTLSTSLLSYKWHGTVPRSQFSLRSIVSIGKNSLTRRGFERRIYFACLRGKISASKIISATVGQ